MAAGREWKAADDGLKAAKTALQLKEGSSEAEVKLLTEQEEALRHSLKALTEPARLEMNEVMVTRHNEVVRKGSRVYDLGDWGLQCTVEQAMAVRRRLNGQYFLIQGNHDSTAEEMGKQGAWVWMRHLDRIDVNIPQKHKIMLCHYAMQTWHGSNKGVWHLYGHSHGQLPERDSLLSFDVGVDCWNYYPVSMEQVIEKMKVKIPLWKAWRESLPTGGMEF